MKKMFLIKEIHIHLFYNKNLSTMKKVIMIAMIALVSVSATLLAKTETAITAANIEMVLSKAGTWTMAKADPNEKEIKIKSFIMKGTGYGEIVKLQSDGTTKTIFCKIYGMNQNAICFADAEGERVIFKLDEMTTNTLRMTTGKTTVTFVRN
jgi:VCBS repeat-containing protein